TTNVWVFVSLAFLAGAGISFFILEVWAFVTDAIDFQLVKTKKRDETNTYAVFSFTRKLGQTLAGVLSTQVIAWVGYNALNLIQTDATKSQIYLWGTLIPALLFIVSGIMLIFWYPLNKKKMDELQEAKISLYETSAAETDALNSFLDDIYTGEKNDNKVEIPGAEYISDSDEGRADE
ncbi:MAG: MFS transporter, partial [Clostridia bacterium]|nr:MFS transporter [Clostridia bacterium]